MSDTSNQVSGVSVGSPYPTQSGSPGAAGPGGNMTVSHAAILVILSAAAALVGLGIVFRSTNGK